MSFSREEREKIKVKLIESIGATELTGNFAPSAFAKRHNLSIQSVYRYLKQLEEDGRIIIKRVGGKNEYKLTEIIYSFNYELCGLSEDKVWRDSIHPLLDDMPVKAYKSSNYIFTEMLNNAIDHSDGTQVKITVIKNSFKAAFSISDNGVGIFTKISDAMKLDEKRFAILELAKGKFTTDPNSHTGEGIFFSSKAADLFAIFSDELMFVPINKANAESKIDSMVSDYTGSNLQKGTDILFVVQYNHSKTMKELFDKYTEEPEHYGFTKTIVPVKLLEYGDDAALFTSRSQAKRLIVRFERFKHIVLDFDGVDEIGQGFADEIFRVFRCQHPEISLSSENCNEQVSYMINRVLKRD